MKKTAIILALVMAAMMLVTVFASCSKKEKEEPNVPEETVEVKETDPALNHVVDIPDGGSYHSGEEIFSSTNGEIAQFPEVANGDKYYFGDYRYTYSDGTMFDGVNGWVVEVYGRKDLETYGKILESINGYPIISINACFKNCDKLVYAPKIPATVVTMTHAFYGCTNLKAAYEIPASVKFMDKAFYNCFTLEGEIVINATPETYEECFTNTSRSINLAGDCANKADLAATAFEGMITY